MPSFGTFLGTIEDVGDLFGSIFGENDAEFCRDTANAINNYVQNKKQVLPGATRIFATGGTGSWQAIQEICPGVPDRMTIHLAKLEAGFPFSSLDIRDPILPEVKAEAIRQGLIPAEIRVAGLTLPAIPGIGGGLGTVLLVGVVLVVGVLFIGSARARG